MAKNKGMEIKRDFMGRFTSKWSWEKKLCFALLILCIVLPLGHGVIMRVLTVIGRETVARNVAVAMELPVVEDKTGEELRAEMMGRLHRGESGVVLDEGEVLFTFDPNSSMRERCTRIGGSQPLDCLSMGPYQLKVGTIQHYYPTLYGKEITALDAIVLANDDEQAREFAERCIIEIQGCIWNWSAALSDRQYFEIVVPIIRKIDGI
jgi:hypothetical protein